MNTRRADTEEPNHDEGLYGRNRNPAWIVKLAAAEWAAMSDEGKLPDGWTYMKEEG